MDCTYETATCTIYTKLPSVLHIQTAKCTMYTILPNVLHSLSTHCQLYYIHNSYCTAEFCGYVYYAVASFSRLLKIIGLF